MKDTKANPYPDIAGHCPMGCGKSLFIGAGGHVTCSYITCPRPTAVDELLDNPETGHIVTFTSGGNCTDADMLRCLLGAHIATLNGPPVQPGRYRVRGEQGGTKWAWEAAPLAEVDH